MYVAAAEVECILSFCGVPSVEAKPRENDGIDGIDGIDGAHEKPYVAKATSAHGWAAASSVGGCSHLATASPSAGGPRRTARGMARAQNLVR